jgi:hypothetical protein
MAGTWGSGSASEVMKFVGGAFQLWCDKISPTTSKKAAVTQMAALAHASNLLASFKPAKSANRSRTSHGHDYCKLLKLGTLCGTRIDIRFSKAGRPMGFVSLLLCPRATNIVMCVDIIATLQATKAYDHLRIPTFPMRLQLTMATRQKGKLTDILAPEAQLCARAAVSFVLSRLIQDVYNKNAS